MIEIRPAELFTILDKHNCTLAFQQTHAGGTHWIVPKADTNANAFDVVAEIADLAGVSFTDILAGSTGAMYGPGSISIPAVRVMAVRAA